MGQVIAVVTLIYNEPHKLRSWRENYETYAHDVALHIIVDDGSEPDILTKSGALFRHRPFWLMRKTGVSRSLQYRLPVCIAGWCRLYWTCRPRYATHDGLPSAVAERIARRQHDWGGWSSLVERDTQNTVEEIGETCKDRASVRKSGVGSILTPGWHGVDYVSFVCGGLHLVPREVFEVVGLQDEQLLCTATRLILTGGSKIAGYRLAIARDAAAWHEHIDVAGRRPPWTIYLWSRNRMLVMHRLGRPTGLHSDDLQAANYAPAGYGGIGARREGWPYAQAHMLEELSMASVELVARPQGFTKNSVASGRVFKRLEQTLFYALLIVAVFWTVIVSLPIHLAISLGGSEMREPDLLVLCLLGVCWSPGCCGRIMLPKDSLQCVERFVGGGTDDLRIDRVGGRSTDASSSDRFVER